MEDQDPNAMGEEPVRADELAFEAENAALAEAEALDGEEPEDEDLFELELDGQVHVLPGALKGAFLRQADYTRKTQELAEQRRALEAERQALTGERKALSGAAADRATLAALDRQLEAFEGVDWRSLAQEDPQRAQALWSSFQETQELRQEFAAALSQHEGREELRAAREAAERMAQTGRTLAQEIDGWSPETAAKLVAYAQAFGVTMEELAEAADPRLWKILHKAWRADQASQQETALQAQAVRPAVQVAGAVSGGGVRDDLGTREWMARRTEQTRRAR